MDMRLYLVALGGISPDRARALTEALPRWRREQVEHKRLATARLASAVGYHLVRYALGRGSGELRWHCDPSGKPQLEGGTPHFSIAHTDHAVAVLLSERGAVGVDLEWIRPIRPALAARFASEGELGDAMASPDPTASLIRLWTRKEAAAKRSGIGIAQDLRQLDVSDTASRSVSLSGVPHEFSVSPAGELSVYTVGVEELTEA